MVIEKTSRRFQVAGRSVRASIFEALTRRAALVALAGSMSVASAVFAQEQPSPDADPIVTDEGMVFPDGVFLPRSLTENEKRYLIEHPLVARGGNGDASTRGSATPPTGPVRCVAEYEPMQAVLVSWIGSSTFLTILAKMGAQATTVGNADYYVVVPSAAVQTTATTLLTTQGANLSRVKFFIRPLDTIWIRDYGPRYIYQGDVRAIVDHTYNRPRPNDDTFSQWFGPLKKQPVYDIPLIHGGGNFHLNALGESFATKLIKNENPTLSETQIIAYWQSYQNVTTHLFDPYPASVDSTQHLDMWVQVFGDKKVMISDWPNNVGSAQDVICDNAAVYYTSQGYTVSRVPARSLSGTHYTYCNVVICNDLLLLPTYTNSTIVSAGHNTAALNAWKSVWETADKPAHKVVQVDCQAIVTSAGVMHCIVMHVPAPLGGTAPTAYLKTPNGGATYIPGQVVPIQWITDDDISVSNVDIQLSLDGGLTWPTTIAAATSDDGTENWAVPTVYSTRARLRVVARDASGNTGADASDQNFKIDGPHCAADFDEDGFVTGDDFDAYVLAFEAGLLSADFDSDGFVTGDDFDGYVTRYELGC